MEKENIINFEKMKAKYNKKISDEEIQALFLGLIKIVKNSARDECDNDLKEGYLNATENFRQCLMELNDTQMKLKQEHEEKIKLEAKLQNQEKLICALFKKFSKKKV